MLFLMTSRKLRDYKWFQIRRINTSREAFYEAYCPGGTVATHDTLDGLKSILDELAASTDHFQKGHKI